jgi:hypothetical protein
MVEVMLVVALVVVGRVCYVIGRSRAERGRARFDADKAWAGRKAYRSK